MTLTAENVGDDGGGSEITCVKVDIPAAFSIEAITIVSVKGETSAASHGWKVVSSAASGVTHIAFKNPTDTNPLVGLPSAGDKAVFRVTGTASSGGTMTWTGVAAGGGGEEHRGCLEYELRLGNVSRAKCDARCLGADSDAPADATADATADAGSHTQADPDADGETYGSADGAADPSAHSPDHCNATPDDVGASDRRDDTRPDRAF